MSLIGINVKEIGIDPAKIEAIQDNLLATSQSAKEIAASLVTVAAVLESLAHKLNPPSSV